MTVTPPSGCCREDVYVGPIGLFHASPFSQTTTSTNNLSLPRIRTAGHVQAAFEREEGSEAWCCFFDRVLALALAYFVEQRVEYIVLEVPK